MVQVALTSGAYTARSVIANAQRCVNLYPERNPQDTSPPAPTTHYPTPGLTLFGPGVAAGTVRGLYRASNGVLYTVIGPNFYSVSSAGALTLLGSLVSNFANTNQMATWVEGAEIIVVQDPNQIVLGMNVTGAGIPAGATVTSLTGTSIGISAPTTTTQSTPEAVVFSVPAPVPPAYTDTSTTPVSMYDNGVELVIVNGSPYGWVYYLPITVTGFWSADSTELQVTGTGSVYVGQSVIAPSIPTNATVTGIEPSANNAFTTVTISVGTLGSSSGLQNVSFQETSPFCSIIDPAFYGSTRVDYLDTYFLFNKPNSPQFYSSLSLQINFDPLYFADKVSASDYLRTIVCCRREIFLIGDRTTEIWYDAGNSTFPFESVPGAFIEHGIAAPYSVAKTDVAAYWLSKDAQGHGVVLQAMNFAASRISNHGVEQAIQSYSTIDDAIGFTFQLDGHNFYVLTFPTADATWVYDMATQQWFEWLYVDDNGAEHRSRVNCCVEAYGMIIGGDWQNGKLYIIDPTNGTDNGQPIVRRRSFPHLQNGLKRNIFWSFLADMQVGGGTAGNDTVYLRWSNTRGLTWYEPVGQSIGDSSNYGDYTSLLWTQLGIARDRVFELYWSFPTFTALNSAYVEVEPCSS